MMCKARAPRPAEHLPQAKLSSCGRDEIFAANDVGNPLHQVVDGNRELVGPVAVAVAQQQIATLTGGFVLDQTQEKIVERLHTFAELNTQAPARRLCQRTIPAKPIVTFPGNMFTRAFARVDVMRTAELFERLPIHVITIALPQQWVQTVIGHEAKPLQVLENARLVFGPAADSIVILHTQQHAAARRTRKAPHVDGVDDVTEVKMPGGRGGVARQHWWYIGNTLG